MIANVVILIAGFLLGNLCGILSFSLCMIQKYDKTRSDELDEDNNNISES